ncbi:hypothetical protein [Embleya sp. NPDC050493]|uniref:hypothetical protein n=1 Tax=Embleya sp. NPDC050493 TaxID=3363989 RepID=UPI0037B02E49
MNDRYAMSRRAVLLGVAAVATSCSSSGGRSATSTPTSGTPAATTAPTGPAPPSGGTPATTTPSALPTVTAWAPDPGDVQPQVKQRAVTLVSALGAWPPGGQGPEAARARLAAQGFDPGLADRAGSLSSPAPEAVLEVVDAQYGGILDDTASVLVVCRRWTRAEDGTVTADGSTVDVRLSRATPVWTVTTLYPSDPGPAAASLSAQASRILADSRIILPPAATADVRAGAVHASVLTALETLAADHTIDVSVLRSGHPINVFGTNRPSDHPRGRAVDVWRIDGRSVVDPTTPRALVEGFMRAGAAAGSYNVGGPYQLSGAAFFSDPTHRDHVHLGFTT